MMFNEYLDHSNQCASYYSVVRKDEINLQQSETNRFKQKWLEVSGCYPANTNKFNTKHESVNSSNSSSAASSSSSSSPSPSTQQQYQYLNHQSQHYNQGYMPSNNNYSSSLNKNGTNQHFYDTNNSAVSVNQAPSTMQHQQNKFYEQQNLTKQQSNLNNQNSYQANSVNTIYDNSTSKFNTINPKTQAVNNTHTHSTHVYNQQQSNQFHNQYQLPNQQNNQSQFHGFNNNNNQNFSQNNNQFQSQDYAFDSQNMTKLDNSASNLSPSSLNKKLSSSSLSVQQQQQPNLVDKNQIKDIKSPSPHSTSINQQKSSTNLIDLNQDQFINDDCDSSNRSNNTLSPLLNAKTNFNETTNTSNSTKSILNEINIDELFIYYPNVFEELFYSSNNPFKLNSIEQIEQDLRTYCEQQFKLNLNNQANNKDTNNSNNCTNNPTNQQFSIRI